MSESLSKLVDYVSLTPGEAITKLENYVILQPGLTASKIVAYAVLSLSPVPPLPDSFGTFGPIPIFPNLPESFPVKLSIVMDTIVGTTKSLREVRVAQQALPLWDIEIPFQELRDKTQNQTPYIPFVYPEVFQQYEEL